MKIIQKIITFMLSIMLVTFEVVPTFASSNTVIENEFLIEESLIIVDEDVYNGNKVIFVKNKNEYESRAIWDAVDVVMAGLSWADFFKEPSLGNFGWAILDTASILPILPSSAYVRKGGKTILKMDEVAKFAKKSSKNKSLVRKALKLYKYSDGISSKAIKKINKTFKAKEAKEVINLFKKAADKGFVGKTGQSGIKKLTGTYLKKYTHEIKVTGKYGAYRIFGYKVSNKWVFDLFEKAHK